MRRRLLLHLRGRKAMVGSTWNLEKRLWQHNQGLGAQYFAPTPSCQPQYLMNLYNSETPLHYGYLDESGDIAPFYGSRYLIIVALLTRNPRPIELHVKRARKSLRRKARPDELKASGLETAVTERLLQAIVEEDVEIATVIVDKRAILRPPADPEDIYREAVTKVVRYCVERHPRLELWLDKRYTKPALRDKLERTVREGIADLARQVVLMHQEDSRKEKGLQAVDHVAWALYQKYERGDDHLYQIPKSKIVVEEIIKHHLW